VDITYTGINHLTMATGDMDATIAFWKAATPSRGAGRNAKSFAVRRMPFIRGRGRILLEAGACADPAAQ